MLRSSPYFQFSSPSTGVRPPLEDCAADGSAAHSIARRTNGIRTLIILFLTFGGPDPPRAAHPPKGSLRPRDQAAGRSRAGTCSHSWSPLEPWRRLHPAPAPIDRRPATWPRGPPVFGIRGWPGLSSASGPNRSVSPLARNSMKSTVPAIATPCPRRTVSGTNRRTPCGLASSKSRYVSKKMVDRPACMPPAWSTRAKDQVSGSQIPLATKPTAKPKDPSDLSSTRRPGGRFDVRAEIRVGFEEEGRLLKEGRLPLRKENLASRASRARSIRR